MTSVLRRVLAVMALAWFGMASPHVAAAPAAANYQGLWWNAQESGWGINFAHQGDVVFATWFTFAADGTPQWYTIVAQKTASFVYAGPVASFAGPPFSSVPFPANANVKTTVGTATITFAADGKSATFDYTVNGITQTRQIVPQEVSSPAPTCTWGAQPDLALATNYQDLWWATNGDESGWGINFTHHGNIIFATWFTYDTNGKAWWLFSVATQTAPKVYAGTVRTATGPAFNAQPWDPNAVVRTTVGDAIITITDGNRARFDYTVNGVTQSKNLTRQVFVAPGTVCSTPLSAAEKRKDATRFLRQATFGASVEAIDALSQTFVVSMTNNNVNAAYCGMGDYFDLLNRGAFGNARDLLRDVTLSPVMGEYLSMKGNAKADPVLQTQPDENYAREVMQLFSVGLLMLNDDGSAKLDVDGKPMPAYNEDTVKGVARALSGWTHAGQDQTKPTGWNSPDLDYSQARFLQTVCPAWSTPMEPWATAFYSADNARVIPGPAHDAGAKQLLVYPGAPYGTLPAGQSARTDLENVIDNLFSHPNVGPFLGKQLIQRLVTSNPSPQYVERVARKFNDNGSGVRGDMKAVVRAILLDDEARSLVVAAQPTFGKLTEPAVRFVQFNRAFNARTSSGVYEIQSEFLRRSDQLNQVPMWAPSVFNFYHPNYVPAGPMTTARLVGPEFEITEAASISGFAGWVATDLIPGYRPQEPDPGKRITPDYTYYRSLGGTPAQMLDALELVLCASCLDPALKALMAQSLEKLPPDNDANLAPDRLATALWWILNSPDYLVQR